MNSQMLGVLKKVIRAILIAEQSKGMPLRILERQYRESEGTSMPLLGYPDTAALLNSLTDTVFMVCEQIEFAIFQLISCYLLGILLVLFSYDLHGTGNVSRSTLCLSG